MASINNAEVERILSIRVNGVENLATLQKIIDGNKEALAKMEEEQGSAAKSTLQYQKILTDLKGAQKEYNQQMQINIKATSSATGSYNDLVNKLAQLKEQWKAAPRNSEFQRSLTKDINTIKGELEGLDHSIGNYQRNVGNYGNSIARIAGLFGGAGRSAAGAITGVTGFTAGLKAMSATPVIAILGALVTLLAKLKDSFKQSEVAANRLAVAFAPLKSGGQVLRNIMTGVAESVASVAEWLGKVAERLGLFNDRMKENKSIAEAQIALTKRQREVIVENARLEYEAAEERNKAVQKEKYSAAERLAALKSASAKNKQILDNNLAIAQQEYDIAKRKAALVANDKAANDELAQKEAALYRVRKDHAQGMRRILSQENAVLTEIRGQETKAAETEADIISGKINANGGDIWAQRVAEQEKFQKGQLAEFEDWAQEDAKIFGDALAADLDALNTQFADSVVAASQAEEKATKDRKTNLQSLAKATASILDDVAGAYQSQLKAEVDAGKISQQEGERRFKAVKALQYAVTGINTATAVVKALSDQEVPAVARWTNAAAVTVAGITNLAKIANTTLGGTQQSSATGQGVQQMNTAAPIVQTITPSTRLITTPQDEERLNAALNTNIKAYVVLSELEGAQGQRDAQLAESGF